MTDIIGALADKGDSPQDHLWLNIPPGYSPMPLEDIPDRLGTAESILGDTVSDDKSAQTQALIDALKVLLGDLASNGTLYCGIGRHVSPEDDAIVSSTLVVSYQKYEGTRNPRLLLSDIINAKSESGEQGEADLVDVLERPMLFFERIRKMPAPQFPGSPDIDEGATSPVFQIESHIPSEYGDELAVIEFSTPFISHGTQFRTMVVEMAASVSFEPPEQSGPNSRIQQLLG